MDTKFYLDTEGNDDQAYLSALKFACELASSDTDINRIVLYIASKDNTGWFERLFDSQMVKQLFQGAQFNDCPAVVKFETRITYEKFKYGRSNDIVICCGMDSDELLKIDDYSSVKYIIAIPWLRQFNEKWIRTWNAVNIMEGNNSNELEQYPEPSCIAKKAMESLSRSINMSTGITHPSDNELAKTFIRALHKYEPELNPDIIGAYLVRVLKWDTRHAKKIETLIETLNEGRYFRGGEKTGLQNCYKLWKKECE